MKAKEKSQLVDKFEKRLAILEDKVIAANSPQEAKKILKKIQDTEQFLTDEHNLKVEAAMFQSKSQYFLFGEKNSRYFYNLEKKRYNSKTITTLKIPQKDGAETITQNPKKILEEERLFYQKHYGNNVEVKWDFINQSDKKLTQEERETLEQELTDSEISQSLSGMANSKTPGSDGLSADFYKVFWVHLKDCDTIRFLLKQGRLHQSARKGIITLLPKKDRDPLYLKNWRPLTLLHVDYL